MKQVFLLFLFLNFSYKSFSSPSSEEKSLDCLFSMSVGMPELPGKNDFIPPNSYLTRHFSGEDITVEQERELITHYQETKDPEALERILRAYTAFVKGTARRVVSKWGRREYEEDLAQDAIEKSIEALDSFDVAEGNRFISYLKSFLIKKLNANMIQYISATTRTRTRKDPAVPADNIFTDRYFESEEEFTVATGVESDSIEKQVYAVEGGRWLNEFTEQLKAILHLSPMQVYVLEHRMLTEEQEVKESVARKFNVTFSAVLDSEKRLRTKIWDLIGNGRPLSSVGRIAFLIEVDRFIQGTRTLSIPSEERINQQIDELNQVLPLSTLDKEILRRRLFRDRKDQQPIPSVSEEIHVSNKKVRNQESNLINRLKALRAHTDAELLSPALIISIRSIEERIYFERKRRRLRNFVEQLKDILHLSSMQVYILEHRILVEEQKATESVAKKFNVDLSTILSSEGRLKTKVWGLIGNGRPLSSVDRVTFLIEVDKFIQGARMLSIPNEERINQQVDELNQVFSLSALEQEILRRRLLRDRRDQQPILSMQEEFSVSKRKLRSQELDLMDRLKALGTNGDTEPLSPDLVTLTSSIESNMVPVVKRKQTVNKPQDPMKSKKEEEVLALIDADPYITLAQIVDVTGFTRPVAAKILGDLKKGNQIVRIGSTRSGYWERVKKGTKPSNKDPIAERKERILALVKENPHVTRDEMARDLKVSRLPVREAINALKAEGKLVRIGFSQDGYWHIPEDGVTSPLNPMEQRKLHILMLIVENSQITNSEIVSQTDYTKSEIETAIDKLKKEGKIARIGSSKHWVLGNPGK